MEDLSGRIGFEWDKGNSQKNWLKRRVSPMECEELFLNRPLVVAEDSKHSHQERRYYALGQTDMKRFLFAAFVIRSQYIRVISARDMIPPPDLRNLVSFHHSPLANDPTTKRWLEKLGGGMNKKEREAYLYDEEKTNS